jgi:hypothetical protein
MYLSQATLYLTNDVPRHERTAMIVVSVDKKRLMMFIDTTMSAGPGGSLPSFLQILVTP